MKIAASLMLLELKRPKNPQRQQEKWRSEALGWECAEQTALFEFVPLFGDFLKEPRSHPFIADVCDVALMHIKRSQRGVDWAHGGNIA